MNIHGYLFKAKMWREYAMEWDGAYSGWVENVLGVSREHCILRARKNLRLARLLNLQRKKVANVS